MAKYPVVVYGASGFTDLLMLLPMSRMNPRYMRHFMKPAEPVAA